MHNAIQVYNTRNLHETLLLCTHTQHEIQSYTESQPICFNSTLYIMKHRRVRLHHIASTLDCNSKQTFLGEVRITQIQFYNMPHGTKLVQLYRTRTEHETLSYITSYDYLWCLFSHAHMYKHISLSTKQVHSPDSKIVLERFRLFHPVMSCLSAMPLNPKEVSLFFASCYRYFVRSSNHT